jgi:hypothetical protein
MKMLGIPMPRHLKDRVKQAADLDRRTMADWARLELERAADAVIAAHGASSKALPGPHVMPPAKGGIRRAQ